MDCREFFAAHGAGGQKCKALQDKLPELQAEWQKQVASEHSPGPVNDSENLIRYWLIPVHFDDKTRTLRPTAFDDMSDKGLSVNRSSYATLRQIAEMANSRVELAKNTGKSRELVGYSNFSASEARLIVPAEPRTSDRPVVGVYDTAKADDPSHADVCQLVSSAQGGRSARTQLRELSIKRFKTSFFNDAV